MLLTYLPLIKLHDHMKQQTGRARQITVPLTTLCTTTLPAENEILCQLSRLGWEEGTANYGDVGMSVRVSVS